MIEAKKPRQFTIKSSTTDETLFQAIGENAQEIYEKYLKADGRGDGQADDEEFCRRMEEGDLSAVDELEDADSWLTDPEITMESKALNELPPKRASTLREVLAERRAALQ